MSEDEIIVEVRMTKAHLRDLRDALTVRFLSAETKGIIEAVAAAIVEGIEDGERMVDGRNGVFRVERKSLELGGKSLRPASLGSERERDRELRVGCSRSEEGE